MEELSLKVEGLESELMNVIPDFKLLLEKAPLFEGNYKYFAILAKEIKDSILKELSKSIEPLSSEIKKVTEDLDRQKELSKFKIREIDNGIEFLKSKTENIAIDLNTNTNSIHTINDILENIKEDILFRATYSEFNALVNTVETKASSLQLEESVYMLKTDIYTCVKKPQFEALQDFVVEIEKTTKKLSTIDMVEQLVNDLKTETEKEFKKYVLINDFLVYKENVIYDFQKTHQKIERLENLQGFTNDAFRKEMAYLDKAVKKRPWKKDIEIFKMNLQEAAKIIELQRHKETIKENLFDFEETINKFRNKCENYEKVLERFDEILLEKAAKDDISEIKKYLLLLIKTEDVEIFKNLVKKDFSNIQTDFEKTIEKFKKLENLISEVNSAFRNFKSDNKDNISIKNNIKDLQDLLSSKAEKTDLLSISQNIIKIDEFNLIKNNLDVLHRQLEMQVVISQAALKTMIKSTDSAMTKNKQRLELLRNISNLLNWIISNSNFEAGSSLTTVNSGLMHKSLQEIHPIPLLPQIKHQRKASASEIPIHSFIDIPKFKGKYDI